MLTCLISGSAGDPKGAIVIVALAGLGNLERSLLHGDPIAWSVMSVIVAKSRLRTRSISQLAMFAARPVKSVDLKRLSVPVDDRSIVRSANISSRKIRISISVKPDAVFSSFRGRFSFLGINFSLRQNSEENKQKWESRFFMKTVSGGH